MKSLMVILVTALVLVLTQCGEGVREFNPSGTIHITVESDPVGAETYWRIASNAPEVRSTNRFYLGYTPYHETRHLNIPGLTKENAVSVVIVIEIKKKGYYEVVERLNLASVLDSRKISLKYQLEKNNGEDRVAPSQNPYSFVRPNITELQKQYNIKPPVQSKQTVNTVTPAPVVKPLAVGQKDSYEPNETPETGTNIYLNREYLASLHDKSDLDHYLIFLGETLNYNIVLDQIPKGSSFKLSLLTHPKDHKEVYSQMITANGELKVNLKNKGLKTGIYCIKIAYVSGSIGSYKLAVKHNINTN